MEKEILKPVTSDKETPKSPSPTPTTGKDADNSKEPVRVSIPPAKTEDKAKDSVSNGGDSTKVETSDKVDTKPTTAPTTSKDTAADSTEKLPVEKTPVPPVATEVKDKVTEAPATATLPVKSVADKEVVATIPIQKVETKPEVLPAETKVKEESKPVVVTEVKDKVTEVAVTGTSPVKSVTDKEVVATIPTEKVETKPEVLPVETKVKEESKPVVVTEVKDKVTEVAVTAILPVKSVEVKDKVTEVAVTATLPVKSVTDKEVIAMTPTQKVETKPEVLPTETPVKDETLPVVSTHTGNDVNADWIARLESIKQRLSNLGSADVVEENAIDRTLIARLEAMTEKLREKTRSTPVSDNTAGLISRLEDMVVQVAPKPVAPAQPVQFEFPQADRPLVGFINDTGLTVNNPAEEKSPIVAEEKPANSTNNPSPQLMDLIITRRSQSIALKIIRVSG